MMENFAKEHGKLLIYVLNKADLVKHQEIENSGILEELHPHVFLSCVSHHGRRQLRDEIKIQSI